MPFDQNVGNDFFSKEKNRKKMGMKISLLGLLANLFLAGTKLLAGYLSHSLSIFADGMNNLADSGSSLITLFSFIISAKPSDQKHPFGHARFEYIASSVISVLIIYFGLSVFREAWIRIQKPAIPPLSWLSAGVLIFSIVMKLVMAIFYEKKGTAMNSSVLEASAADARSDVRLTSVIFISAFLSPLLHFSLDGPVSLLVGLVIVKEGGEILLSNFDRLIGKEADPNLVEEIKKEILAYPGVCGIHDLLIHDYGPNRKFVSCHVMVDGTGSLISVHDQMDRIERDLFDRMGIRLTIHMDPVLLDDPDLLAMEGMIKNMVCRAHPDYSIHDLQIRKTKDNRRISFDLVIPWKEGKRGEEGEKALKTIQKSLSETFPSFQLFINLDHEEQK